MQRWPSPHGCATIAGMLRTLEKFETLVNGLLLVMMAVVVALLTVKVAVMIPRAVLQTTGLDFNVEPMLALFGDMLLVLIGLELMHSVKIYLVDHVVHVEVILSIALVALARKLIIADMKQFDGLSLIGLALLVVALAVSHYMIRLRPPGGGAG